MNKIAHISITIVAILYSVISHELAHGYMAYLFGDDTAKVNNRLKINPINHIDPIGLISMLIIKFGWAKPVPINPNKFNKKRLGLFFVSIAGITVNFISAILALTIIKYFFIYNIGNQYIDLFLELVFQYGIILASFNLIPIPPLDGSKIIASFLPERIAQKIMNIEMLGFFLFFILSVTGKFSIILDPIYSFFVDLVDYISNLLVFL